MQLAEPLLTVAGYIAMTQLRRISSIIRRVTDDSVAAKLKEEKILIPSPSVLPFQWKGPKESPAKEEHKAPVRRKEVKECNEEAVKSTMINEIEASEYHDQ